MMRETRYQECGRGLYAEFLALLFVLKICVYVPIPDEDVYKPKIRI